MMVSGQARTRHSKQIVALSRDLKINDEVLFIGSVDAIDLPVLYSGRELFLFPSKYEGLGLPPLEAISYGTLATISIGRPNPEGHCRWRDIA
jgi:glycosyltransferase involved in cell wall biosynthesis